MGVSRLRALRQQAGWTQAELAIRAGVSRQLVGAVEGGRHLPRVDAAVALAAALGVDAASLFAAGPAPVDAVSGSPPADGSWVRVGRVGDRPVTAPARIGADGWDVADAVVTAGTLTPFGRLAPGLVVAGCEPGLEVLERLLREGGMGAVSAIASSVAARAALEAERVHAAVVHGPGSQLGSRGTSGSDATPDSLAPLEGVVRFRLARWRVGLAAPPEVKSGWWREALSGRVPVVQREAGAGVQRSFEQALRAKRAPVPGPRVASHLEAARRAVLTGMAAVTIEPAARAIGAAFHPLEVHEAELWVAVQWLADRAVADGLDTISSARFQRRLGGVGGYDLTGCGAQAT